MKDKQKGRATRKQTRPKRMTEVKRLVNFKQATSENQTLILKFDKAHPDMTFDDAGAILTFIRWLEKNDYSIIHREAVFCVPFSHLVEPSKLK